PGDLVRTTYAGIVDGKVQGPEGFFGEVNHGFDRDRIAYVDREAERLSLARLSLARLDLADDTIDRCLIDIRNHNTGAAFGKFLGMCLADTRRCTGDDLYLSCKLSFNHSFPCDICIRLVPSWQLRNGP